MIPGDLYVTTNAFVYHEDQPGREHYFKIEVLCMHLETYLQGGYICVRLLINERIYDDIDKASFLKNVKRLA